LYRLLALAGGLLAYSVTHMVGGNGFLAVYLMGLVVGNRCIPHRQNLMYFMEGLAWGAQIVMFLLLGLLVFPDQLPGILAVALLVTLVMMLVARPLAVYPSLEPLQRLTGHHDFSWREYSLLSGAGLKGAVPIILAIFPLLSWVENGEAVFNIIFVVVVVSTTV
jgi:cell volume regulation protein A